MATYRSHKQMIKESLQSDLVYKPIWFTFDFIDSFLGIVFNCRKTINTETQVSKHLFIFTTT